MIADAAEATLTMPGVNLLDGEVLALRRSRAMDDDLVNLSTWELAGKGNGPRIYNGMVVVVLYKGVSTDKGKEPCGAAGLYVPL
mgnify:CR=1 FL=1